MRSDLPPTASNAGSTEGGGAEAPAEVRRTYERPRIVWQEGYEPMSFGVSCAKQPGNPGCGPGPFSG